MKTGVPEVKSQKASLLPNKRSIPSETAKYTSTV